MKIEWNFRMILGLMFSAAFIVLTCTKQIPTEAFTGVAGLVIGYWFKPLAVKK